MPNAQILVNVYDGARKPLAPTIPWIARISDGRPPSQRHTETCSDLRGPSKLFSVECFDNFFDDYTIVVSANGFKDMGWFPVRVHPSAPTVLDLLALPSDDGLLFADATWQRLNDQRANVAGIIARGCAGTQDAKSKYGEVLDRRPKALACFLNIATALAQMTLPSGKSPLEYYWNIAWPQGDVTSQNWLTALDHVFKQDRFFCYVEAAILPDVQAAAKLGAFAPEPNPGAFHSDATESYKQTQFDVSNVQLTFHGHDTCTLPRDDGSPVQCVKIEPDIDYFKDLLSHGLLEVLPNTITHGLTEPSIAYALRWIAGRRAGSPLFNPLYTVE